MVDYERSFTTFDLSEGEPSQITVPDEFWSPQDHRRILESMSSDRASIIYPDFNTFRTLMLKGQAYFHRNIFSNMFDV